MKCLKKMLITLAIIPAVSFAELDYSNVGDLGLDTINVVKQLKKLKVKVPKKAKRVNDQADAVELYAAGESFWSTTIYANPNNSAYPVSDNDVVLPNRYYLMLAPRNSWAPSNTSTTHVATTNFEINTDNSADSRSLRVEICSWDMLVQQGLWACGRLKSEGGLISGGAYNGIYERRIHSGSESLYFNIDTTAFNNLHDADNSGYIFRVAHVDASTTPVDTTMIGGVLFNYY